MAEHTMIRITIAATALVAAKRNAGTPASGSRYARRISTKMIAMTTCATVANGGGSGIEGDDPPDEAEHQA